MSIVCTLKCDHLALPKLNLRKPAAARNVLLAKGTSKSICNNRSTPAPTNAAPVARMTATSFERSRLLGATGGAVADELKQQKLRRYKNQEQQGIMVAEFVERQHSSGSPVNGETPSQGHSLSDMPDTTVTIGSKNHPSAAGKANNIQQQQQAPQQQMHHPGRMDCLSPELSLGGKSNGPLVGHTCTHGSSMLHQEPPSPQSSEGDHSISEHVHHLNNSSSSSSSGKYGSGSASPNGSSGGGYDVQHMSKAQQQQQVKELFTQRKQREFIPDNKKDDSYWDRRRRNNEAAKRSREKRRYNDMVLEQRVVELTKENHVLKAQLDAIRDKFNISGENLVSVEQIMASLPTSEQVLSITKRAKIGVGAGAGAGAAPASVGMGPSIVYAGAVAPQPEQSSSLQAPPLKHQPATQGKGAKLGAHLSGLSHLQPGGSHSVQHFVQQASPPQLHPYGGGQLLSPTVSTTTGSPALSTSPLHLEEPHPHPQAGPHIQPQLQHQHQPHLQQHQQQQHSASLLHSPIPLYSSQIQGLPQVHHRHHLQVLKAFNRNVGVSGDDIDNLRKVVAVVGAMTAGSAPGCGGDDVPNSGLYRPVTPSRSPPHSTIYAHGQSPGLRSHPYKYTSVITSKDHTPTSSASSSNHGQGHAHAGHHLPLSHCQRAALLTPPSAVDAVVSSSMALLSSGSSGSPSVSEGSPLYSDPCAEVAASVLNLSHRASSPNYELLLSSSSLLANSSSHSSSVCSGDDEHEPDALYDAASIATTTTEAGGAASTGSTENPGTNPNSCSVISSSGNGGAGGGGNNDSNNSLPLKLRHKSHLGDKDAAANALLALQHIKQEPISSRLSPRSWTTNDGDNSSDERDSGISIVSEDWTARFQRAKLVLPEASSLLGDDGGDVDNLRAVTVTASERDHILKSQLARLESEVANIKNMMIMTTTTGTGLAPSTASASGFATTAQ